MKTQITITINLANVPTSTEATKARYALLHIADRFHLMEGNGPNMGMKLPEFKSDWIEPKYTRDYKFKTKVERLEDPRP